MDKKEVESMLKAHREWSERLQNRIVKLEQNQQITCSRLLTEKELNDQDPHLIGRPTIHTDTYSLKEVVKLLLDYLGLEPKKVPEIMELTKPATEKKGKK